MCSKDLELGLDTQNEMNRAPVKMTNQLAVGIKEILKFLVWKDNDATDQDRKHQDEYGKIMTFILANEYVLQ